MKRLLIASFVSLSLISCGSSKSGTAIGQEVCDCYAKANGMKADDPGRTKAQQDCGTKQVEAWNKVKDNDKKSKEFNEKIGACGKELIEKSLGQ